MFCYNYHNSLLFKATYKNIAALLTYSRRDPSRLTNGHGGVAQAAVVGRLEKRPPAPTGIQVQQPYDLLRRRTPPRHLQPPYQGPTLSFQADRIQGEGQGDETKVLAPLVPAQAQARRPLQRGEDGGRHSR